MQPSNIPAQTEATTNEKITGTNLEHLRTILVGVKNSFYTPVGPTNKEPTMYK